MKLVGWLVVIFAAFLVVGNLTRGFGPAKLTVMVLVVVGAVVWSRLYRLRHASR